MRIRKQRVRGLGHRQRARCYMLMIRRLCAAADPTHHRNSRGQVHGYFRNYQHGLLTYFNHFERCSLLPGDTPEELDLMREEIDYRARHFAIFLSASIYSH